MSTAGDTLVVVNPNSGNGRTGRGWPRLAEQLRHYLGEFRASLTSGPGEATGLVRQALRDGCRRIVAVGGDGTNNEVVNGFFAEEGKPLGGQACLGLVPRGTGGDLRKSLGIGLAAESWGQVLAAGRQVEIDLGRARFHDDSGRPLTRHFINITSFGLGGLVDDRVNNSTKALGGKVSFMLGTLKALGRWRNQQVDLEVQDGAGQKVFTGSLRVVNVVVANGQYFGGGMWVAPRARLDDGLFDVVVLGDLSKGELMLKTGTIYRGTHLRLDKVRHWRGSRVVARSPERVLIDMDGEQPGQLPIELEILPRALRLLVPDDFMTTEKQ